MATYTKETSLFDNGKIANGINEAKGTANNYIAEVSNDGIFVHQTDAGRSGSTPTALDAYGVHISDDVDIIEGGVNVASFGSTARIGADSSPHVIVNNNGMTVYTGSESDTGTNVASFGTTARIGATSGKHITINNNGMTYYKGSETEANTVAVFGSDIALYRGNKSVVINSRGIRLTGEVYAEGDIVARNIDLGDSGRIYMPNNYAIHAMHALSDTTDPLIFISQSDNIVVGSEDWNDCYIHCVYSPKSGTSSSIPNVRITDGHRLTRTTHSNSSVRFKHDIKDVENKELDPHNLYDIKVKQFRYNDDVITDPKDCRYHKDLIGFIAEQVRDVYPVAVDITENGECEAWSPQYIVPPMLALLQEQHEEIEMLKQKVQELEEKR